MQQLNKCFKKSHLGLFAWCLVCLFVCLLVRSSFDKFCLHKVCFRRVCHKANNQSVCLHIFQHRVLFFIWWLRQFQFKVCILSIRLYKQRALYNMRFIHIPCVDRLHVRIYLAGGVSYLVQGDHFNRWSIYSLHAFSVYFLKDSSQKRFTSCEHLKHKNLDHEVTGTLCYIFFFFVKRNLLLN